MSAPQALPSWVTFRHADGDMRVYRVDWPCGVEPGRILDGPDGLYLCLSSYELRVRCEDWDDLAEQAGIALAWLNEAVRAASSSKPEV